MKGDADKSDIFQHNENKTHANAAHIKGAQQKTAIRDFW